MILVSACLVGINCRYDGGSAVNKKIVEMVKSGKAVPVCPEQLGGGSTPRPAAEIQNGDGSGVLNGVCRVLNKENEDVTEMFIKGAEETLKIAKLCNSECAILKSRSPSCGKEKIHSGKFDGRMKNGNGVTAELLLKNNIAVLNEDEI